MAAKKPCEECGGSGEIIDKATSGVRQCACSLLQGIAAAMEIGVRTADARREHFLAVKEVLPLQGVIVSCNRADALALHKAWRMLRTIQDPAAVRTVTDAHLAKNYFNDGGREREEQGREPSNYELVCPPQLLIVELGVQRSPHKSAAPAVMEAVQSRAKTGRPLWLMTHDESPFDDESPSWSDELGLYLDRTFARRRVSVLPARPRTNPFAFAGVGDAAPAPSAPRPPAKPKAPPKARTQTAAKDGPCEVCKAVVRRGEEFVWHNMRGGRAHPACMEES